MIIELQQRRKMCLLLTWIMNLYANLLKVMGWSNGDDITFILKGFV